MGDVRPPAQSSDDSAAGRDDSADRRDAVSRNRDDAADRRDAEAEVRDDDAFHASDDLDDRLTQVRRQILARFARIQDAAVDVADWPDLSPAAFVRVQTYLAEQRRLADIDREVVVALLDDVHNELRLLRSDRSAAARDRHASAQERHRAAGDRQDSARDRALTARDRGQAAIERELVEFADLPPAARTQ